MIRRYAFFSAHALLLVGCSVYFQVADGKATLVAPIFDAYFCLLAIYCLLFIRSTIPRHLLVMLAGVAIYTGIYGLWYFQFQQDAHPDYFQYLRSTRYLFYLMIFVLIGDISKFSLPTGLKVTNGNFRSLFLFLAAITFVVYLSKIVIFRDFRPQLYAENNFEVPALLLMMLVVTARSGNQSLGIRWPSLVYASSFMSLSKSGILEAVFVLFRSNMKVPKLSRAPWLALGISGLLLIAGWLISYRLGDRGIQGVDRLLFLKVFVEAIRDADMKQIFFGHGFAAELPLFSCQILSFWAGGASHCTATVFHSFLLRLAFETGLVGVLITYGLWLYLLLRYYGREGLGMFVVIGISSLSVSAFNNSIILWPLFLGVFVRSATVSSGLGTASSGTALVLSGVGDFRSPAIEPEATHGDSLVAVLTTQVNINLADAALIAESLDGIGMILARKIIDYRTIHGEFRSIEDLLDVPCIGHSIIDKNADRITLNPI